MTPNDLPEQLVRHVSPHDAKQYAQATGWHRQTSINGSVVVYNEPSGGLGQLIVPLESTDAEGYARLMSEVIRNLAERERRPPAEVLSDLLLPAADVLRLQIADAETVKGAVPLERGIQALTGLRKSLLAAAHSSLHPQKYHPRLSRAEAEQFVQACRLGQTERGSFTATIACPLDAVPAEAPLLDEEPFTRKVTMLLMRSLDQIAKAIDENKIDALLDSQGEEGISGNLCEGILAMRPRGDEGLLSFNMSWSKARPTGVEVVPATVALRSEYFPGIERLVHGLRPVRPPRPDDFVGYVDTLNGDPDENGRMQGEVFLLVFHDEELIRARAELGPDEYLRAHAAHISNAVVKLKGVLHTGARTNRIEQVSSFERVS